MLSDVVVEVESNGLPPRLHRRFHVEKLKPFNDDPTRFPTRRQINRPIAEIIDKEKEYEVEKILGERITKEKGLEYKVLWCGYPIEDSTWERATNLQNAPEIRKEWELQKKKNKQTTSTDLERKTELELEEKEEQKGVVGERRRRKRRKRRRGRRRRREVW